MPKIIRPLTSKEVDAITSPGTHHLGGVSNLLLMITASGERYYVLRYRKDDGKFSKVSLGPCRRVSLAEARKKASDALDRLARGLPAVEPRKPRVVVPKEPPKAEDSFEAVAYAWFDEREKSDFWANDKRGAQHALFFIRTYLIPPLGFMKVADITPRNIMSAILPIYQTKVRTADKCLIILRRIFFWAKAHELVPPEFENPADKSGTLGVLLEPYKTRAKAEHYAALSPDEIPAFFVALRSRRGIAARMLEFCILTALRSQMVRYAKWSNVDFEHHVLKIEPETIKTKGRGPHFVFLSTQAEELLKNLPMIDDCPWIFPGPRDIEPMTDAAMGKVIKDMSKDKQWIDREASQKAGHPVLITPHGTARASFKTWASTGENRRKLDSEAVELCLAHKLRDDYDGAYNRAELEPERRMVMQTWGDFCYSEF